MATQLSVKVKGLDVLVKRFNENPKVIAKEIKTAITGSIQEMQNKSRKETPYRTGDLRRGILYEMESASRGKVFVKPTVTYAAAVHDGSVPHIIRSHGNYPLRNKKTGQVFGRMVNHPGNKPNPFFVRGIEQSKPRIEKLFDAAINNVVKALAS